VETQYQVFVKHIVLKEYIQDTTVKTGIHERTLYNTKVDAVVKERNNKWNVRTSTWNADTKEKTSKIWVCAVNVGTGASQILTQARSSTLLL